MGWPPKCALGICSHSRSNTPSENAISWSVVKYVKVECMKMMINVSSRVGFKKTLATIDLSLIYIGWNAHI